MLGLAIELRTQCSGCGRPLPLNAFAENTTCAACNRVTKMEPDQWKGLLEDSLAEITELDVGEGRNRTIMTGRGKYELMFGRQQPRCAHCKTELPDQAVEFADRGWVMCVGCGKRMSIRRAPDVLVELGVFALVGEDATFLTGAAGGAGGGAVPASVPDAPKPVVLYCPNCKAPLSVDGSKRLVNCQYCSTDVYLPDELWQRLNPAVEVARWYAWLPDIDVAARARARFEWSSLADAVMDAHGNIYCAGESSISDRFAVWCMGPDLAVRWISDGLDFSDSNARIAIDAAGRLLLWQPGKHSLTLLSVADGSTIGKLGGKEAEGAREHGLDLDDCKLLLADVDGTILALIGERFVRYAPAGHALATWPPRSGVFGMKPEKLHPLYRAGHELVRAESAPYIENIGHQPMLFDDYTKLCIGLDGRLYGERSEYVACFDREGKRVYRVKIPLDSVRGDRIAGDASGRCYLVGYTRGDPEVRKIVRVSADGERVDVIAIDRRHGGSVGSEDHLVVMPDGSITLLDYGDRVRRISPDGRLVFQSAKSRADDAEEDERAARKE